jgi:hypothetical protein
MGSGAYVDSSDERFKTNIVPIQNASTIINQLNGIEYSYRTKEFPEKNFQKNVKLVFLHNKLNNFYHKLFHMIQKDISLLLMQELYQF